MTKLFAGPSYINIYLHTPFIKRYVKKALPSYNMGMRNILLISYFVYRRILRYFMGVICVLYGKPFYYLFCQISDLIYRISYIIYKISDILFQISNINKISYMSIKISHMLYNIFDMLYKISYKGYNISYLLKKIFI